MSSEIVSREELKAMIEVQSKNVEQLTVIANHLATIVERENKIYERLYNGLAKDISNSITTAIDALKESVDVSKEKQTTQCAAASPLLSGTLNTALENCSMSKDIGHVKWFVGIVGVVIVVATVILGGIDRRNEAYDIVNKIKSELVHATEVQSPDLKAHLAQTKEAIK